MTDLCCPSCGHNRFKQTQTTRTDFVLSYEAPYGWFELSEECVPVGDMGDSNIVCADCAEVVDDADLITYAEYTK